jgi:hypothetical protein
MYRAGRALPIVARHFSSDASHAPPKKLFGVTGKYAEALYVAASKVLRVLLHMPRYVFTNWNMPNVKFALLS